MVAFRTLFAVAITCSALSCILLIVAMTSTGWITGLTDSRIFANPMLTALAGEGLGNINFTDFEDEARNFVKNLDISGMQLPFSQDVSAGSTNLTDAESRKNFVMNLDLGFGSSSPSPGSSNEATDLADDLGLTEAESVENNVSISDTGGMPDLSSLLSPLQNPGTGSMLNLSSIEKSIQNSLSNVSNFNVEDFMKKTMSDAKQRFEIGLGNFSSPKRNISFSIGFFKMSMGAATKARYGTMIPIPVVLGSIFLVVAIMCSFAATFVLVTAAVRKTEPYEEKSIATSRSRMGIIILAIAGVTGLAGMIVTTASTGNSLNSPMVLVTRLGTAFGDIPDQVIPRSARTRRSSENLTVDDTQTAMMKNMVSMLYDLHFGFSFYLGWFGVVFLLIGTIVAALARHRMISVPYNESNTMRL